MNQAAELLMSLYAHSAFDPVRARSSALQYSFGFAWGSFQYGRVVTYFSFASKRSFRNSFSVSCILARILLAVVGPHCLSLGYQGHVDLSASWASRSSGFIERSVNIARAAVSTSLAWLLSPCETRNRPKSNMHSARGSSS